MTLAKEEEEKSIKSPLYQTNAELDSFIKYEFQYAHFYLEQY